MSDRRLAALLALTAFLMRYMLHLGTAIFGTDGENMLRMSEAFFEGRFREALGITYHPLFPFLASMLKPVMGVERGAMWVSMVLGGAAAAPLFLFARDAVGRPAAFIGALLYAFQPHFVDLQSDVMTEGTFSFFAFSSAWLGWESIRNPRWDLPILAGVAAGAAYLTRPEGVLFAIGIPCWIVASAWRGRSAARLGTALLALAPALLIAYPYLLYARSVTGRWTISAKGSVQAVEGSQKRELDVTRKEGQVEVRRPYYELAGHVLKLSYFVGIPLLLAGLWGLRRSWALLVYLSFPILYWAAIAASVSRNPYTSYRYFMPGMAMFLPLAGLGVLQILRWIRRPQWMPWAVALVLIGFSIRSLRTLRQEERPFREAAAWIKRQPGVPRWLACPTGKIPYLAGTPRHAIGHFYHQFPETWSVFEKDAENYGYGYIVCLERGRRKEPEYRDRIHQRFGEPVTFGGEEDWTVYVYKAR